MKVIFLDVDGVLNSRGTKIMTPSGFQFVEDIYISRLKRIIEVTGAKVVLSSSWRQGFYDIQENKNTRDAVDYLLLKDKLLEFGIEIYSHTPLLDPEHRGTEILSWIGEVEEEIEAMVILDDINEVYPLGLQLVKTSNETGLLEKHVERAIEQLQEVNFEE